MRVRVGSGIGRAVFGGLVCVGVGLVALVLPPQAALAAGPDAGNTIYVANDPPGADGSACAPGGSIAVFAPGANGDVAPIRTISGPATGINCPGDVVVNSAGDVYVSDYYSDTITEYGPGASGNQGGDFGGL